MFDKLKAMGSLAALMKDKDKLRASAAAVRVKLDAARVFGEGGGGAVRVTANGSLRVLEVEVSPGLLVGMAADEKTRTLAGTLIVEATNDALKKAQEVMREVVGREMRELGLPEDILGDLGGLGGMLP